MEHRTKRKGVTLVEALMVIGVLAVILGLAIVIYHLYTIRETATDIETELSIVFDNVSKLNDQGDRSPSTAAIIAISNLPSRYIGSKGDIITRTGSIVMGTDATTYQVELTGIPKPVCTQLYAWSLNSGVQEVLLNGNSVTDTYPSCEKTNTLTFVLHDISSTSGSADGGTTGGSGGETSGGTGSTGGSNSGDSGGDAAALTPAENDLAALMKAQMETAAAAKANYAAADAAAASYQAAAQAAAAKGDYDAMNQAYNNMNQAYNDKNSALAQWNQALDYGNKINAATQGIYGSNGQDQAATDAAVAAAAKSVGYTDPTTGGI